MFFFLIKRKDFYVKDLIQVKENNQTFELHFFQTISNDQAFQLLFKSC